MNMVRVRKKEYFLSDAGEEVLRVDFECLVPECIFMNKES